MEGSRLTETEGRGEGGSDSGVETNCVAASCDSSLVSCGSEEALRDEDEGGSEGSSASSRPPRAPRPTRPTPTRADRSLTRQPHLARSVSLRQEPATKKPGPRSPLDDGRWPSTGGTRKPARPADKKLSVSLGPTEARAALGGPRRRRGSLEDLTTPRPPARDVSLNRAASLRRKKEPVTKTTITSKPRPRTRIFHEVTCQTALTLGDMESVLRGAAPKNNPYTRRETASIATQVDYSADFSQRLEEEIKGLQEKISRLSEQAKAGEQAATQLAAEREARIVTEKRLRALVSDKFNDGEVVDSIEKHCNLKNEICFKQQQEIAKLQQLVVCLKRDLEKSSVMHRKMMEHQVEVETESIEIQEFLQAEKCTLAETLKELEVEVEEAKKALASKEAELEKQKSECLHMVRISEQRRQEKMALEVRLKTIETSSRNTLEEQGSAISGATVALTALGAKLERLIEALVTSYNISQQDLEDVVYHNEAYSGSGGSSSEGQCESSSSSTSPDQTGSPQRSKPQGFLANIFKALWATPPQKPFTDALSDCELLSAEPEPASFSLPETVTPSKRHSLNSIASDISREQSLAHSDDQDIVNGDVDEDSSKCNDSLRSLSQAILLRQREEEISRENLAAASLPVTTSRNLLDLAIHLDNQVSRLLNIMHFVHKRKVDSEESRLSVEAASAVLKEEIAELNDKLESCNKSSEQVVVLQKAVTEKEKELKELEMKFELTQELLTSNWHKAMSEVKRQYEAIDAALEALDTLDDDTKLCPALIRLQRELEGANTRCSTTLPVSTSNPDLNANPSTPVSPRIPVTVNGKIIKYLTPRIPEKINGKLHYLTFD